MVTTTSITAVSVSMRSAQSTFRSPDAIQVKQHLARILMAEADAPERHPGQHRGDEQEQRGDELGRARARGRRLVFLFLVMRGMDDGVVAMRRRRAVAVIDASMAGVVLGTVSGVGIAARMTRARAGERDQAGDDAAEQRQEDDRLIHYAARQPFIRLMSSTAIEPRLR